MNRILMSIFEESNFQTGNLFNPQEIDSFYAISKDQNKINYYAVLFIDNLVDIEEKKYSFNAFYEDFKKLNIDKSQYMDKNLSMIVCVKRNTLEVNESVSENIYQIEEDPHFFKKYVLTYTDKQVKLFNEDGKSLTNKILDFMYTVIHDHGEFLRFKCNPYQESVYNLVSKIFIKLPFLSLRNLDRQTENLSNNISDSLSDVQIDLKNKALACVNELTNTTENNRDKLLEFIGVEKDE